MAAATKRNLTSRQSALCLLLLLLLHATTGTDALQLHNVVHMQLQQQQLRQHQQPDHHRSSQVASVIQLRNGSLQLVLDKLLSQALAQAELQRSLNATGWDVLDVRTGLSSARSSDVARMRAAGLLEGFLTADRIALNYANLLEAFFPAADKKKRQQLLPKTKSWLSRQLQWARNFGQSPPQSAIQRHTTLLLAQFDGLVEGFFLSPASCGIRDQFVLLMLNAVGDLLDLLTVISDEKPDFKRMSDREFRDFVRSSGHCSALVKVTPGLERMFMGHSSWFLYASTMRIYKHYSLNLEDKANAARRMSFSSYAGFLESLDDFYIMDSGLVLLQTTNNVFNTSLYQFVSERSLLAWQRVRVANQIARSGSQWASIVRQHNSGTYNNQYMLIDLSRFHRGRRIDDGALTIVEQIPSLVESSDQTPILRTGYWPSYNVPFHQRVYNLSGYPDVVKQRGLDFSYQMAPRAKIFRREAASVVSNSSMGRVLRFNDYKRDPYSEGNSCNSICCRGDLVGGASSRPDGCYDSKFTSDQMAASMTSFAISGPSLGTGMQPLKPFSWAQFPNVSHLGLPSVYRFDWVAMRPK